jgi:hypothetical protein
MENLSPDQDYFVRAYAKLSNEDIIYGDEVSFHTSSVPSDWSINITEPPEGNEVLWPIGKTKTIKWESAVLDTFVVELFDEAVTAKYDDITVMPNYTDGSIVYEYIYTLPDNIGLTVGNSYAIRVQSAHYDFYDIVGFRATSPYFAQVDRPQTGDQWNVGREYTITWQSQDVDRVDIILYKDGVKVYDIKTNQINNNSTPWFIDVSTTPGTGYTIGVYYTDYPEYYAVSQPFEILSAPYIQNIVPNSNSTVNSGTAFTITWEDNISENVKIELYQNATLVETITNSTASTGSYTEWIPNATGSNYTIKITSVLDPTTTGTSAAFTIN